MATIQCGEETYCWTLGKDVFQAEILSRPEVSWIACGSSSPVGATLCRDAGHSQAKRLCRAGAWQERSRG